MKIQLNIDSKFEEVEVHICAKEYTEQVEQLMKQLQTSKINAVDGYVEQDIHMIKIQDIYYIYAEDSKVYLQTVEQEFESKRKLYELESMLAYQFVRVSKSMLINMDKIASIQVGAIVSTEVVLEDESSVHVSRKYLKELKSRLGIGRV